MGAIDPLVSEYIVLFDGLCNLCSSSVQFIIKHDSKGRFKFASLQSQFGRHQLNEFGLPANQLQSVLLIKNRVLFQKSSAALEIARGLDGLWPAFYFFKIVPRIIRDWVYGVIADNRYKWFGKKDSCMIPTPELKFRFID